jgi:hypothetical protein
MHMPALAFFSFFFCIIEVEIWNLDVLDAMEPVVTLGGRHDPDPAKIAALKKLAKKDKKKYTYSIPL